MIRITQKNSIMVNIATILVFANCTIHLGLKQSEHERKELCVFDNAQYLKPGWMQNFTNFTPQFALMGRSI